MHTTETDVLAFDQMTEELEALAELDLFAEDLPERLNMAAAPMGSASTISSASCLYTCASSLSSLCCFG